MFIKSYHKTVKRKATNWDIMFETHCPIKDKELASKTYRELLQNK